MAHANSGKHSSLRSRAVWISQLLLISLVSILPSTFAVAQERTPQASQPLAFINGQPIYGNELPSDTQGQLLKMEQQIYAVRLRGLHTVLGQKLIEAEAKKKGVSQQDLFQSEVLAKVPDPSDDEVKAYYQAHQSQLNQPFEAVKDKIRQNIKDLAIQKRRVIYIQSLMQESVNNGELVVMLSPPTFVPTADPSRLRGDPKAPITIVEFSDFSCPFCRQAEHTINELLAKYPGKVKVSYRDFPLTQLHPQAQLAAEASRCAGDQGKYWEYHDLLFSNPEKQTHDSLMEDARTLKLDEKQFDTCLSSEHFRPQIDQDMQLGARGGVVATPGFFVNGTFLSGAQPASAFEKIIDADLAASSQKNAQVGSTQAAKPTD
jgi:protein-disulfide isomerase